MSSQPLKGHRCQPRTKGEGQREGRERGEGEREGRVRGEGDGKERGIKRGKKKENKKSALAVWRFPHAAPDLHISFSFSSISHRCCREFWRLIPPNTTPQCAHEPAGHGSTLCLASTGDARLTHTRSRTHTHTHTHTHTLQPS